MADALGVSPTDLLPNAAESAIDADVPSIEMRVSVSAPGTAWLRVNRMVTVETAAQIISLVNADAQDRIVK